MGQNVAPAPAGAPRGLPAVEILGLAPHVDHAVDRSGAAQDLAAWLEQPAVVQVRLRFAFVAPVDRRIRIEHRIAERNMDERAAVPASGLEQQDRMACLAQPAGDGTTGRTRTDHHKIILRSIHLLLSTPYTAAQSPARMQQSAGAEECQISQNWTLLRPGGLAKVASSAHCPPIPPSAGPLRRVFRHRPAIGAVCPAGKPPIRPGWDRRKAFVPPGPVHILPSGFDAAASLPDACRVQAAIRIASTGRAQGTWILRSTSNDA